jgi:hypothetical protein
MFLKDEAFLYRMVNGRQQGGIIVLHIEQTNRFLMSTRLRPRDGFE